MKRDGWDEGGGEGEGKKRKTKYQTSLTSYTLTNKTAPKVESDFATTGSLSASLIARKAMLYSCLADRLDSGIIDMLAIPTTFIVD